MTRVIVVKMQTLQIKTHTNNTLSKLSIITSLLKNRNSNKLAFKSKKHLNKADDFSSQKYIIVIQKQTKSLQSTHKLHSPHPFI